MTSPARSTCVVDTNVAVVANNKGSSAGPACIRACTQALDELTRSGRIAIDDSWRIIREYQQNLSDRGQPGAGNVFLKWLLTNRKNPQRCIQVPITPTDGNGEDYVEFPHDPALVDFDPADRKFVAVAVASDGPAPILQAVDRPWWHAREALSEAGVAIAFLCQEEIAQQRS